MKTCTLFTLIFYLQLKDIVINKTFFILSKPKQAGAGGWGNEMPPQGQWNPKQMPPGGWDEHSYMMAQRNKVNIIYCPI